MAGRGNDAQGNYVTLGFGSETCQTFLQARSNGLDMAYRHWVTGYLTAVNLLGQIPRSLLRLFPGCYCRVHERLSA